jgi:flap endonuclease-1
MVRYLAVASSEFLPSRGRSRLVPPEIIDLEETLKALGLTRDQLIDVALLVGTDFNEGVKGIGPKTAVKRIREWGSLDHAPSDVRIHLPGRVDEIRAFFRNPPVTESFVLATRPLDAEGVLRFLSDDRDFAASRIEPILARLRTAPRSTRRLEDFA